MVARIRPSSDLGSVVQYNEKKVAQDKAKIIQAKGFLHDKNRMTVPQKMERFERLNELNTRSKVNTLHISLNFDPREKLTNDQMTAIADRYMAGLKMQDQPYIVYRHHDAGHPHIHIVTSLIQPDGKRIRTEKMGKRLSSPTRKEIEKEFNLIPAQHQKSIHQSTTGEIQKVIYGPDTPTKAGTQCVLEMVNRDYRFTNLPEYNAILRQYNVIADLGSARSQVRKHGGLNYRVLDEDGKKVGPLMKASSFPSKPILIRLQEKFQVNKKQRSDDQTAIRDTIGWARVQQPATPADLLYDLQEAGITIIIQKENKQSSTLTYVDNFSKAAVQEQDLGRKFNLEGLFNDFSKTQGPILQPSMGSHLKVPQLLSTFLQPGPPSGDAGHDLQEQHYIRKSPRR